MIEGSVLETCQKRGISRRRFMEFCAAMATTLALPSSYAQVIANALSQKRKPVLVWLEFQDCAGNTESMLRSSHPTVEDLVLETFSWEYHETIMAGYGKAAEAALSRVVREEKGKYLVVVEGAIPTADDGVYCTIGGRTALDIAREVCGGAAVNIAVGACAWDGGLVRSNPNPTGALGLQDAVPGVKIVNLPGCPHNPANTAAVLGALPYFWRDACSRSLEPPALCLRADHSRPVRAPRPLRCRALCAGVGRRRPSQGMVPLQDGLQRSGSQLQLSHGPLEQRDQLAGEIGHGCIACASPRFWDTKSPFYERLPHPAGFGVDVTASEIGWTVVGAVAVATAAHGVAARGAGQLHPETGTTETPARRPCPRRKSKWHALSLIR